MKALAWAMLAKGVRRLKELQKRMQPLPARSLGRGYVDEIMRCL